MFAYQPTNPERINPEFEGIAYKYSSHKKNRLDLESKRNSLFQNLNFKMGVDKSLDKNLEDKKAELKDVKGIRARLMSNQQNVELLFTVEIES